MKFQRPGTTAVDAATSAQIFNGQHNCPLECWVQRAMVTALTYLRSVDENEDDDGHMILRLKAAPVCSEVNSMHGLSTLVGLTIAELGLPPSLWQR